MALGGGTFVTQNKVLPGAYINFVSASNASAILADRGVATMPLELDWGEDGKIFEVTGEDFQKNSLKIFGYEFTHEKMKGLRDLFLFTKILYVYKLTSGGAKARNKFAEALHSGVRGNDIKIVISKNVDDVTKFDVVTMIGNIVVDEQLGIAGASALEDNDFVKFDKTETLEETAGLPLTGGSNGVVTGASHQNYLDLIETFTFNTMGVVTDDSATKTLYASFVKRLRDDMGKKFQLVLYNKAADYMGTINVKNSVSDQGAHPASLVYWVTGATAGCEVNKSNQNRIYNGCFDIVANYTQNQLKASIEAGEFVFHRVDSDIRVLDDINSMVTTTDTMGEIFKDNQTVRVIDQIGNDIAVIFNTKYLGVVPNDKAGRCSFWSDIVKHHEQLEEIRAIEDFDDSDIVVSQGNTKKSVVVEDAVTVMNAMSKLYMTVTVA